MSQGRRAPSEVRLSAADAAVIVGVLRLVEPTMPSEVRPLSSRVIGRVERGLEEVPDGPGVTFSALTTLEAEALRLTDLLVTSIAELAGVVSLLETVTSPDDRPVVMTTIGREALRGLTDRLTKLMPVDER